jgi:hypothetical protein
MMGAALATVVLTTATGCTTPNASEAPITVAPLDEAAMIRLKQMTAADAEDAFGRLAGGGATVQSAMGSWTGCADDDPSFGHFNVTGDVTIPAGQPVPQLDPLVSALESDGWTAKRQAAPKGNALADLRKSETQLELTTDGSTYLQAYLIGPCVKSDLIGTDGYRLSIDHTTIDVG